MQQGSDLWGRLDFTSAEGKATSAHGTAQLATPPETASTRITLSAKQRVTASSSLQRQLSAGHEKQEDALAGHDILSDLHTDAPQCVQVMQSGTEVALSFDSSG